MKECPFCGSAAATTSTGHHARCPSRECGTDWIPIKVWDSRAVPPVTGSVVDLIRSCLDVAGVAGVTIDEGTARAFLAEWAEWGVSS